MLDRYELLYEAGLIEEARRDGREAALARKTLPALGEPMRFDHRRILATAIARLRAKLKYRPVVFELMPREFTLTELQRTVEAISGRRVHKQNFRRLVETRGTGRADRRDVDRDRRTAGGAVSIPPRRAGGASGRGTAARRPRLEHDPESGNRFSDKIMLKRDNVYAWPAVSNIAASIASRAPSPAQTTNWNAG